MKNRFVVLALLAVIAAFVVGCGGSQGPFTLGDPGGNKPRIRTINYDRGSGVLTVQYQPSDGNAYLNAAWYVTPDEVTHYPAIRDIGYASDGQYNVYVKGDDGHAVPRDSRLYFSIVVTDEDEVDRINEVWVWRDSTGVVKTTTEIAVPEKALEKCTDLLSHRLRAEGEFFI